VTTTVAFGDAASLVGTDLGTSDWLDISQARIGLLADATDDHQWIHTDPVRAKDGPFGAPVAHGYLTLSLLIPLWTDLLDVTGVSTKVNYGLNKVRFPAPVPAGTRIRLIGRVVQVEQVSGDGIQITADVTVEIGGSGKPACVAQPVFRFYR
jgi:acyl dehydratase